MRLLLYFCLKTPSHNLASFTYTRITYHKIIKYAAKQPPFCRRRYIYAVTCHTLVCASWLALWCSPSEVRCWVPVTKETISFHLGTLVRLFAIRKDAPISIHYVHQLMTSATLPDPHLLSLSIPISRDYPHLRVRQMKPLGMMNASFLSFQLLALHLLRTNYYQLHGHDVRFKQAQGVILQNTIQNHLHVAALDTDSLWNSHGLRITFLPKLVIIIFWMNMRFRFS